MKIKSILGYAIGGIAAITGLGSLISGCSEDTSSKPVVKISQGDLERCCGTDKQSASYSACVTNYQRNGVCSFYSYHEPEPVIPPVYGMPPVLDPNDAAACCGSDTKSKGYDACIQKMYKACPADMGSSQKKFDACIDNYKEVNSCSVEPPPQTDYGMPPYINPNDADACCGTNYTSKTYKDCVNKMVDACPAETQEELDACIDEYKKLNHCGDIIAPEYGMPLPEIDPNDAKACCGSDVNSKKYQECVGKMYDACPQVSQKEFDACIDNYKEVNSCSVEPPPQTDYGMPPVIDPSDAEACCGPNDDSKEYIACIKEMYDACPADMDTPQESFDKCIANYREVNKCVVIAVPEYGVQDVNPQDILECCGPEDGSSEYKDCFYKITEACGNAENYDKCIADYKKTNECGEIGAPTYGMPPVLDPGDAEACCGSDVNSSKYKECVDKMYDACPANMSTPQEEFDACIDKYKDVNSCSVEPPPQTDYGMPPVLDPSDAEACCGSDVNSDKYKECVKDMYKACPANMSTPQEEFDACIDKYKEVNSCSVEPPPQADYGMPSPPEE